MPLLCALGAAGGAGAVAAGAAAKVFLLSGVGVICLFVCVGPFSQQQNAVGFQSLGLGVVHSLSTSKTGIPSWNPGCCCVGTLAWVL